LTDIEAPGEHPPFLLGKPPGFVAAAYFDVAAVLRVPPASPPPHGF
jgi:hypothetical protein